MTPIRFCIVFLGVCLALGAAIAALNVAVDPYLLFDFPRHAGFNAFKPAVKTRERLIKAYAAPRSAPRTVILGSSRCDVGLNPASPVWRASDRPVYNLSLPGTNLTQLTRLLQHVIALNSPDGVPRTVIVCLDFDFFLFRPAETSVQTTAAASQPGLDEFEARLAVLEDGLPNRQRGLRMATDYANSMFSLAALADSAITVSANVVPEDWNITPDGHLAESMFEQPLAMDGVADLFAAEDIDTLQRFSKRPVLSERPGGTIVRLQAVRKLIEIAKLHRMSMIFSIQPSHADAYEIFDQMGYWDDYERWKRALAELVAAERRQGAAITLWDFGGYESFSQERVPASEDRTSRLRWFWDSVHYTSALGDIMAARMLKQQTSVPYGVELTPDVVEERLARIRLDRDIYRARVPAGEAQRRAALLSGANIDAVGRTTVELWREDTMVRQLARFWQKMR